MFKKLILGGIIGLSLSSAVNAVNCTGYVDEIRTAGTNNNAFKVQLSGNDVLYSTSGHEASMLMQAALHNKQVTITMADVDSDATRYNVPCNHQDEDGELRVMKVRFTF